MDFIKRYLSIIIPGAILVVGLVFVVLMFMVNSGVSADVKDSISKGNMVMQLAGDVPPKEQLTIESSYQGKHQEDADKIEQMFLATTTRALISYDVFPKPLDTSRQIFTNYGKSYEKAIEAIIASMSAADAPSEAEIAAVTASTGNRSRTEESDLIVDAFCKDKALKAKVYASPTLLPWFDFWRNYNFVSQKIAIEDCWNSQVAFWVYEDITESVNALNKDARSIMDGPLKRIIGINFMQSADNTMARTSRNITMDVPSYITEKNPPILIEDSWTARKCNEDVDVIHFSLSVVVAVDKVPDFMKSLCSAKTHKFSGWDGKASAKECSRNQITILSFNTVPIDRLDQNHKFYRYGSSAVVQWTGVCEYIFARKAYDPIMPESIKMKISGQTEQM